MDERAAWDRFWSYNRLSSFGTGVGSGNYGPAIADGWREFFAALPAASRVLDIATGNGAVAVLAVEAGDKLEVTGADLAAVKPAAFVSGKSKALQKVRFLPGTAAEQLPLADGCFAAVVSQYGIEYSDMERSLPEAARVLAPGGRMRLACHAAEGAVAANTRRALADADFLLDELDLIAASRRCFQAIRDVEEGRAQGPLAQTVAQGHYAAFRQALAAIAARLPNAADPEMLTSVHQTLSALFQHRQDDLATLLRRVDDLGAELAAHQAREKALLAAARSSGRMQAMADRLSGLGLVEIRLGEQRDGSDLVGHLIEARRLVE